MTYSTFFILSFLAAAQAANDWSKPCVTGVCSYDLPSTNGSTSSGTMKIWGSQTAIGDVTEAAGWKILGCSPDELTQEIRLVCMGGSLCQHLSSGHGAADTIVRLPENCGKGPFARVQKMWVPTDQSIPASIAARIARRDGSQPQVQAITLDTNFAAVNNTKTGTVNLAIKGANIPGVNDILDTDIPTSQRRSRHNVRGAGSFVADAANCMSPSTRISPFLLISTSFSDIECHFQREHSQRKNVQGTLKLFHESIWVNRAKTLPAADFSKKVSLFDQSVDCPPISASVSADMDATAHAVVTIGIAASGTIVPPAITDFSLVASLTADLNGELSLTAELSGTVSTGSIKLFEAGIPGLDFPGILSVGPTFEVNAVGTATSEIKADLTLGLNYHVNNAQLFFPPNGKAAGGTFSLGDTPLKLSADTKVEATTTVSAHLIPTINIGLSALDIATATVGLELDASASMVLKVEAGAGASATIQQANRKRQEDASTTSAPDSTATSASATSTSSAPLVSATTATETNFGGSVTFSAGLELSADATGSFFSIFSGSKKISLFKKDFELFSVRVY
ncbi:hypothetical protein C8F04DRAFT_945998 [Mycena alexandri]|uniref:DUF7223 domain-containing protein n=1 Tax=Mycena alexandri TaxID=1745969 RepID=A0AAD6XBW9_9AGAR|nr:hypothetical protein C8F04DRAFT_945998 [Mycena alexandri]